MSKIFISYDRSDKSFTSQLKIALEKLGYTVWVDFEELQPSVIWSERIGKALKEAVAFIYLLSPESIRQGSYCKVEFADAEKLGKKIIPVLLPSIPSDRNLPEEIRKYHFIKWSEFGTDPFEISKLQKIIQTNFVWAEFHARLTSEADLWNKEGRKRLEHPLNTNEVSEAKLIFSKNTPNELPQPTQQIKDYVSANEQRLRRNRNRWIISSCGVLFTFCMLVSWGFYQQTQTAIQAAGRTEQAATAQMASTAQVEAETLALSESNAKATAQAQADSEIRVNRSNQLSNQANAIINDYPQLNLLLLAEAKNTLHADDKIPGSLYQNLHKSLNSNSGFGLGGIRNPDNNPFYFRNGITQFLFSTDGSWLVTTGVIEQNNISQIFVRIYHLETFRLDMSFQEFILSTPISLIAITPQGELIASADSQTAPQVFDLNSSEPFDSPTAISDELTKQFPNNSLPESTSDPDNTKSSSSSDGKIQATLNPNGKITILDLSRDTQEPYLTISTTGNPGVIKLSPDGNWLIASGFSDVTVWDLTLPEPTAKQFTVKSSSEFAISPDSQWLVTSTPPSASSIGNINVQLWNLKNLHEYILTSDNVTGNLNADNLSEFQMSYISYSFHGHEGPVTPIQFSPNGQWLLTESAWPDGTMRLWDIQYLTNSDSGIWRNRAILGGHFVLLGDKNQWLITKKADNSFDLWNLPDNHSFPKYKQTIIFSIPIDTYGYTSNKKQAVFASRNDGMIEIWDFNTQNPVRSGNFEASAKPLESYDLNPNGTSLIVVSGEKIKTIELVDLSNSPSSVIWSEEIESSHFISYSFSPNGKWLFVTDETHFIQIWNLDTQKPVLIHDEKLSGLEIEDFEFSPDSKWLYFTDKRNRLHLWGMGNSITMDISSSFQRIIKVIFSPNSKWLSFIIEDNYGQIQLELASLDNGLASTAEIGKGNFFPSDIIFTPDSKTLIAGNSIEGGLYADAILINLENLNSNNIIVLGSQNLNPLYTRLMKLSPDGHWLATVQETTIHVWDLRNLNNPPLVFLHGQEKSISAIDFSSDGEWLATGIPGGAPETVMLWSLSSKPTINFPILLNQQVSYGLDFIADQNYILVDGELIDLDMERLATIACMSAGRNLSTEEWGNYFSQQEYHLICPSISTVPEAP